MKKYMKFLMIVIWAALLYIFFRLNLLNSNLGSLNKFFSISNNYKELIFIALSSLRIVALIPSIVFIIIGGLMFNPIDGFALNLISIILSETIVYMTSNILVESRIHNYIVNKYPKLYEVLLKNNTKILSIGILCPIAPSDAICFLASSTGLSYRKFIFIVITANTPMILLYSFMGYSAMSSIIDTVIISVIIAMISGYSIFLWNKAQREQRSIQKED